MEMYQNREACRRPHGHFQIVGDGYRIDGDTLQCCHCGKQFIPVKGSGIERGFCMTCHDVTCGDPICNKRCLPQEKFLQMVEKNAAKHMRGY